MKIRNLYSRICAKLRSEAGESISETIVSVLIAALALVMLAGAVSTASHVITTSKDRLDGYYAENEKIITMSDEAVTESTHRIRISCGDETWGSVPVKYYINNKFSGNPVITYKKTSS